MDGRTTKTSGGCILEKEARGIAFNYIENKKNPDKSGILGKAGGILKWQQRFIIKKIVIFPC